MLKENNQDERKITEANRDWKFMISCPFSGKKEQEWNFIRLSNLFFPAAVVVDSAPEQRN